MSSGITHPTAQPSTPEALKNWIMVVLTLIFILLYGAALIGWLKPLADEKMVMRLEPIIFVIIGYYFSSGMDSSLSICSSLSDCARHLESSTCFLKHFTGYSKLCVVGTSLIIWTTSSRFSFQLWTSPLSLKLKITFHVTEV